MACDDPFLSVLLTVLDRYIASAKRAKHAMQEKLTKKSKEKLKGSQEADLGDQIQVICINHHSHLVLSCVT